MDNSAFGFEHADDSLGFLLWQTTLSWQRLIRAVLDPYDISHSQFVLLAILLWFEEQNIEPTQIMMVNWSKLDKMTVSQSLKKLGARNLVKRSEHNMDSRAKITHLTTAGKALIRQLIPFVEGVDTQFFSKISIPNQHSLIHTLRVLKSGL